MTCKWKIALNQRRRARSANHDARPAKQSRSTSCDGGTSPSAPKTPGSSNKLSATTLAAVHANNEPQRKRQACLQPPWPAPQDEHFLDDQQVQGITVPWDAGPQRLPTPIGATHQLPLRIGDRLLRLATAGPSRAQTHSCSHAHLLLHRCAPPHSPTRNPFSLRPQPVRKLRGDGHKYRMGGHTGRNAPSKGEGVEGDARRGYGSVAWGSCDNNKALAGSMKWGKMWSSLWCLSTLSTLEAASNSSTSCALALLCQQSSPRMLFEANLKQIMRNLHLLPDGARTTSRRLGGVHGPSPNNLPNWPNEQGR